MIPIDLRPEILQTPNTPKPLHGVVPRLILGAAWWDRTRHEAYESTDDRCLACGVHKSNAVEHQWMEGHELYRFDYPAGRLTYLETVPLCHYCHNFIHDGRQGMLLKAGGITLEKFLAVLKHGKAVLKSAGLVKPTPYVGPMPAWEKWRLVLFGKEYPPVYKTFAEWKKAYKASE
jgi:hypothetical protein